MSDKKYGKPARPEVAYLEIETKVKGKEVTLKIADFQLAPTAELAEIVSKVKDSRELIDYWAIEIGACGLGAPIDVWTITDKGIKKINQDEMMAIDDRLCRDFKEGKIFRELPLIPPEWKEDFVLKVIPKEDPIHVIPEDVIFLTNIQQLEERMSKKKEVEEYIDRVYELPVLFFQCPENKEA